MWNQRCDNVFRRSVLIETLWNVNNLIPVTLVEPLPVLIETLWNVNLPANNL